MVLGWHSFLQQQGLPFISPASMGYAIEIFSFIKEESDKASTELANIYGEPLWCKGTGKRNSHQCAIAPTVSNSLIVGTSASIEPIPANAYTLKTAKGTFLMRNPILQKLLVEKGKDTQDVWDSIVQHEGTVQHLDFLSEKEKELFLTFKEINQLDLIKQAAVICEDVDQAVSINVCFAPDDTPKWISKVHTTAWELGIKTLYYLRTESILKGDIPNRLVEGCSMCEG